MNVQLRQLISQQEVQIQQKLQKEVCTCITHYGPVATEVMCMTCHQETKSELSVGQATFICVSCTVPVGFELHWAVG